MKVTERKLLLTQQDTDINKADTVAVLLAGLKHSGKTILK